MREMTTNSVALGANGAIIGHMEGGTVPPDEEGKKMNLNKYFATAETVGEWDDPTAAAAGFNIVVRAIAARIDEDDFRAEDRMAAAVHAAWDLIGGDGRHVLALIGRRDRRLTRQPSLLPLYGAAVSREALGRPMRARS